MDFTKMHGIGNDFVIVNNIGKPRLVLTKDEIMNLCNRNYGIGCDQLVMLESSEDADCNMYIYNPEGSESGACGNATRCVAKLLGLKESTVRVGNRKLIATLHEDGEVSVDMGPYIQGQSLGVLGYQGYMVNIGNPHFVTFITHLDLFDLKSIGPRLEHHPIFPEHANINFVEITASNTIKLRVWERGAGETLACGSGACASSIVAHKSMGLESQITVALPGGSLTTQVKSDKVIMSGPAQKIFTGRWEWS